MMVGFNVTLPAIKITWVGNLTWKSGLIALIEVGRPILTSSRGHPDQKRYGRWKIILSFACLIFPFPIELIWFTLFTAAANWIPLLIAKAVFPSHHCRSSDQWFSRNLHFWCLSGTMEALSPPCKLNNYQLSFPFSQWETAVTGLFQPLKHPASRPSGDQILRLSGVI